MHSPNASFSGFNRRPRHPRRTGSVVLFVVLILVLVAGAVGLVWYYFQQDTEDSAEQILTTAAFRGEFEHIVLEQGVVESSSNVEIKCEVKAATTSGTEIIWVIDEGTQVKKGDKLVDLKTSALEKEQVQQQIVCNTSNAAVIQAENTLRAAEIARLEYLEGAFRQEEQLILSEIFVAEENLRRAQLAFQSTERLAARGIVTSLQLEGDQFAVEKARNELEAAQTKVEVLRKYTKAKMLKQFDSDIATAEAKWEAEKESYQLELEKLQEIKDQIGKCTIVAPEDGQVVYANTFNRFGGDSEFVIEQGALVRENQVLIRLPDPTKMQVKATINESRISLVRPGMPVAIEFDAIRGQTVNGRVTKVNQYAEPTSWRSGNIKEYAAYIEIFDPPADVRSGMNAEVRIFVEKLDNVLQIPVQALYETKGHFFCLLKDGEEWETREVQVGSSNDSFMMIKSGLDEGQTVVLNPRAYAQYLQIPTLPEPETPRVPEGLAGPQASGFGEGGRSGGPPAGGRGGPGSGEFAGGEGPGGRGAGRGGPGGGGPGEGGPGGGGPGGGGFDPSRLFSMVDADGDGVISAQELANVPEDRRSRMAANDTDGDGTITRDEFMKAVAARGGGGRSGGGGRGGTP